MTAPAESPASSSKPPLTPFMPHSAETRIVEFLVAYPGKPLRIAVGYASVWGLAWLGRHTQGRSVKLLIGDAKKHRFEIATERDRRDAISFLSRVDVQVMNWYTKRGDNRSAHMKAWHTTDNDGRPRILAGSANLTQQGLQHNAETMGEYSDKDVAETLRSMDDLFNKSWNVKDRLLGYLESAENELRASMRPTTSATQATTASRTNSYSDADRHREPSRSTMWKATAQTTSHSSTNKRSGRGRRRPTTTRVGSASANRRPSSNRRKTSTSSGLLQLWWRLPRRVREAVLSLLGVVILVILLLVWINSMNNDSDANSSSAQPLSAQPAAPQSSFSPSTQLPAPTNPLTHGKLLNAVSAVYV